MTNHTPILLTGAERTGTTWAGHMLTVGGQAVYLGESFNVFDRCIWMKPEIPYWCQYICRDNEQMFLPAFQRALQFRYPLWQALRTLSRRRERANRLREFGSFMKGKFLHLRPLFKDPSAIFSAPWVAERLNAQVVITIRHPLAFVSSRKRLKWPIRLGDWLAQPLLVRDLLHPYVDEVERAQRVAQAGKADLIDLAIMYWRTIYQVVAAYRERYPQFILVRHEDLSLDPLPAYKDLYSRLGLEFNQKAEQKIVRSTSAENPTQVSVKNPYDIRLDSRSNLENWKHRLDPEDIRRIRSGTEEIASIYYSENLWEDGFLSGEGAG